jgi:NADH-quinone oxidoreductase subunit E
MATELKPIDLAEVVALNKHSLIAMLYAVQKHYNYLPESVLRELAKTINKPLIEIYRVATFYKLFSLEPRGRHKVVVCTGTACHVRGSEQIADEASRCLCLERGKTSEDGEFSLDTVNCLGGCALGPLIEVDGEYHGNLTKTELRKILENLKQSKDE